MTSSIVKIQEEIAEENILTNEYSVEPLSPISVLERNGQKTPSLKTNCYILTGKNIKELRLSQAEVGGKSKAVFDIEWGWCFSDLKHAEEIAKKHSKNGKEIKASAFFSEQARRKWNGTKLERKAAGLETRYILTKQAVDSEKKRIRDCCHNCNFDIGLLYEDTSPENFSEKQKETFEFLKPQFKKWEESKEGCKKLEQELVTTEAEIKKEKNAKQTDPNDWPFHVLGYTNTREVILWHKGQLMPIKAKEIGEQDLKLLCGPQYGESWAENRDAILNEAYRKGKIRIDDSIKTGVWKREDCWVIVSGKKALVVSEGQIKSLDTPVFDGRIIELSDDDWLDEEAFRAAWNSNESMKSVFEELHEHVRQWNWESQSMSEYFTAFTFLLLVHQAMDWRPWLYISGSRGSAKTLLVEEVLSKILRDLSSLEGKTTAHAIAQTIGNTAKIPVLDEFEKNPRIDEILELLKGCNRGKGFKKKLGTTGDTAKSYTLSCLPVFASITMPPSIQKDSAQQTRTVLFEMKKPNQTIRLITDISAKNLCAKMLAVLLKNWENIQEKASAIRNNAKEIIAEIAVEERTIDNFKYASGLLSLAMEVEFTVPSWAVQRFEDDGEKILRTILSCKIKVDINYFEFVSSLLAEENKHFIKLLEQNGIKCVHPNKLGEKPYLAISSDLVSKHLLRDDEYYRSIDVAAPLARIEGAIRSFDVKIGGSTLKCVLIPMQEVDKICGREKQL